MSIAIRGRVTYTARHAVVGTDPTPLYVGPADRRSFAWLHPAIGQTRDRAVVLCGPFEPEMTGVHRTLRHWAADFARAGCPSLRIDYHGMGDSPGAYDEPHRLRAWIDSVGDAVAFMRAATGIERVAVVGVGIGAAFALAAAAEDAGGDISELILWAPVVTGKAFLREGRAFTRLMAPAGKADLPAGHEQLGGFVVSPETVAELTTFDPLAGDVHLTASTLIIPRDAGARDTALIDRLGAVGAAVERRVAEGYGDMMLDTRLALVPSKVIQTATSWLIERANISPTWHAREIHVDANQRRLVVSNATDAERRHGVEEFPLHFGTEGRLFGVVSRPTGATRRSTGILLSNAGSVAHVGPNRFYVTLARIWAALGFTVLRMDLAGLGDSDAPEAAQENHPYPAWATSNVAEGVAALRAQGVERVIVGGLCSGAHTAFHCGLELQGLAGLMMINPIVFYWKPSDSLDISSWMTYVETQQYQKAARRWRSWVRLFRGRVDVARVARTGVARARELVRAKRASFMRSFRHSSGEDAARDLARLVDQGMDVLLFFSAGEPGLNFLRVNYARELRRLRKHRKFTLLELEDANHTFTALGSRIRAAAMLTAHLLDKHP